MSTISFTITEEESKLIQAYVATHKIKLSSFVRELLLDRIEDDMEIDEARVLAAREALKHEKVYNHEEVWKELGI